jgi:hypothetical protein
MPLHLLTINNMPFAPEAGRNPPGAVERTLRIEFIYPMLQGDLLGRRLYRLVIEASSIQP